MKLLEDHPERFSPNVILRPVYQEVILPNLCYIGGGGELAYWFQLKSNFERFNIPFPVLLLRNSALIYSKKQAKKIKNLEMEYSELFLKRNALINKKIRQENALRSMYIFQKMSKIFSPNATLEQSVSQSQST